MIQLVTPYDKKRVFVQKITFVLSKNQQMPPELHFLAPIAYVPNRLSAGASPTNDLVHRQLEPKSAALVAAVFEHWGSLQRSLRHLALFRGPTSKRRVGKGREEKRKGGEG